MTAGETRVLLVEDDPAVRSALLGALEDAGFEALGASDARAPTPPHLASIRTQLNPACGRRARP
jgi:DNA-binding response OmpR family regulator